MLKKGTIRLILLLCIVFITIVICSHLLVLYDFSRSPEYRVLSAEEIRPIFIQITERQLPDRTKNLRAIYSKFHSDIEGIFLAFQTDQEGFSYILDEFGGRNVKIIEFPESEVHGPWITRMLSIFSSGCYQQEQLGIELFDEDIINRIKTDFEAWDYKKGQYPKDSVSGWYLDYSVRAAKYYFILLFKDTHLAYIYAGKNPRVVRLR
jgi:hypothetical protein